MGLGVNIKTLERKFTREVGLTPKLYTRIKRLQTVLRMLDQHEKVGWADIAYGAGYVDQAHFIKDFRNFAGVTPKSFVMQQNAMSDSFVV